MTDSWWNRRNSRKCPARISIRPPHASSNFLGPSTWPFYQLTENSGTQINRDSVIFCGVRISIPHCGVVNNGANINKLTTLAQCLRPCHVMTYLSCCTTLVCSWSVFRDSHELFMATRYLTVICNVLWLTICSFLLFWLIMASAGRGRNVARLDRENWRASLNLAERIATTTRFGRTGIGYPSIKTITNH